jgi:transcriptional regulator with XRE-family HTH domain
MLMQTIGEKIARARKDKGLTQQDLADFMGMIKTTYAHKEKNNKFTKIEAEKILDYLGLTLQEPEVEYTKNPGINYQDSLIRSYEDQLKLLREKLDINLVEMRDRQKIVAAMVRVCLDNQSMILESLTKVPKNKIQAENNKAIHDLLKNN